MSACAQGELPRPSEPRANSLAQIKKVSKNYWRTMTTDFNDIFAGKRVRALEEGNEDGVERFPRLTIDLL